MKIKTEDLIHLTLEWAVAKCEGHNVVVLTKAEQEARWFEYVTPADIDKERQDFIEYIKPTLRPRICIKGEEGYKRNPTHIEAPMRYGEGIPVFAYSTSWIQGGPIIERERIHIAPLPDSGWRSHWRSPINKPYHECLMDCYDEGVTALIAAMRCYVASKLGDEVDIPEELL